jgi:type IV secretion system protein VirD4
MAYICSDPGELKVGNNNLARLIDILSLPLLDQDGFCEVMINAMASQLPFIRNIASRYASSNSPTLKTTENVRQTAQAQLTFLNEPLLRDFLSTSEFEFAQLRRQPMTIYCMLPQDVNISYPNFSRLMVECFFSSFTIKLPAPDDNRVLVILDEQAQLKFMESIADAPALLRGYKVRIWSIYQNIGQMKQFYDKKWEEFISAAGMIQFMSPNDEDTAEYISKRVGNHTLTITTTSQSTSKSSNIGYSKDPNNPYWDDITSENTGNSSGTSVTTNETQIAVPFLSRQDLYAMPSDRTLLFLNGLKYPVMAMRDSYLDQGETYYNALYAPHPVYDPNAFAKFKELAHQCRLWPNYLKGHA